VEVPSLGKDGIMAEPKHLSQRRYSPELKARAVRAFFEAVEEQGGRRGVVDRVARQLGVGSESLRGWVAQAEVDAGRRPGLSSEDASRIAELERENRELRRANAILRSAASFFAAEMCATRRWCAVRRRRTEGGASPPRWAVAAAW
jgi:transposase